MKSADRPSRREFLKTAAISATTALATTIPCQLSAQESPPSAPSNLRVTGKQLLQAVDFTYRGCFRCPPGAFYPSRDLDNNIAANTAFSYYSAGSAPFASRVVNGQRRFFIVGHGYGGNQVIEIALPEMLSHDISTAPIAETVDFWAGDGGGVYGPNNVRKISRNWPNGSAEVRVYGLLWDTARQLLWWSIGEAFQTSGTGSPVLGYAKLTNPTGSATKLASAEAFGPWDLKDTISNHTSKGMIIELPPELRPLVGGRRLGMGGAHFHSILGPHDFGPAVIAVDEPTDRSVPVAPQIGYPWNSDRQILDYVNVLRYGAGTPSGVDSHGKMEYLARAHRAPDYSLLGINDPPPVAGAGGTTVNPAGGSGWWTHGDVTIGAVWVDNTTRQGLVFTGGAASGRTWYTTSGYVNGVPVPPMFDLGERTRIGFEFYNPCFYIVSLEDLIRGATLGYGHYQQEITVIRYPKQSPESTREGSVAWPYSAPVYDAANRRLYVLQAPGWRDGLEFKPLVHCWEVAD